MNLRTDFLKIHKGIQDNICGYIGLTKAEFDIVNLPIFQRLRRISQLGMAHYVFPTITHNRFVHSLGVLYFADKMITQLQTKSKKFKGKRKLIRMAALLHDVGHYPLSHTCEKAVIEFEEQKSKSEWKPEKVIKNKKIRELHDLNKSLSGTSHYADHKNISALIVNANKDLIKILRSEDIDPLEVGKLIVGKHTDEVLQFIIKSNACADMFDFLVRDSKSVGWNYGLIQANNLIKYFGFKKKHVGFYINALRDVEHFVFSTYLSYLQIPFNKDVAGFNLLAKNFYLEVLNSGKICDYWDILKLIEKDKLIHFDDNYFYNFVNIVHTPKFKKEHKTSKFSIDLAHMIKSREPLKEIISQELCDTHIKKEDVEKFKDELKKIFSKTRIPSKWRMEFNEPFPLSPAPATVNSMDLNDEGSFEIIKIIDKKGDIQLINNLENTVINHICKLNTQITRYYTKNRTYAFIVRFFYELRKSKKYMSEKQLLKESNTTHDVKTSKKALRYLLINGLIKKRVKNNKIDYDLK